MEVLLLLLLLTVPLSLPQVAGGWGDVAMLQAVAGLSPPYCPELDPTFQDVPDPDLDPSL